MVPTARVAAALTALAAVFSACQRQIDAATASPSLTWAALNRELLVSYAVVPGFSHCSPAQDAAFTRPELLRDYDPQSPLPCSSQSLVASAAQPKKTAAVLVAVSKCFQDATIATIASWASSKLLCDSEGGKVVALDGTQDTQLAFTFALVDATCASTSGGSSAMSTSRLNAFKKLGVIANSFSAATNSIGKSTTTATAFAAVISFVENAAAYTTVEQYESNAGISVAFNFALCEGSATSCGSAAARAAATTTFPNANYLAQTSQLKDVEVFPSTPRYSCDQVLTNGTPVVIGGGSNNRCTCVCPRGYALVRESKASVNGRCEAISSSSAASTCVGCAWDSYGNFQHQVTESDGSGALSTVVSAWGLPVPVLERSRSAAPDQGQVIVSCTRKSDPPIYDARAVSSAVARHASSSSSSSAVLMTIPSWAKTAAREFGDPTTTPSSNASTRSSTMTWRQYEAAGSAAVEQSLSLAGFGVYELQVRATRVESSPYAQHVSCVGCLAVTDHFRPHGATTCPSAYCDVDTCDADSVATAMLTASNLNMAREAVAAVATFQLNASNDDYSSSRCDDMQIRTRSFHANNTVAEMTTVTDADEFRARSEACFSPDTLWSDLLLPGSTQSAIATLFTDDEVLQLPVPVNGQCTRCCWLSVQLRETWIDYQCEAEFATQRCEGLDSEPSQCSLSQCLLVDPAQLFTLSVSIREDARLQSEMVLRELSLDASQFQSVTQIHRAIVCENLDGSNPCTFRAKLAELVSLDASFAPDFQDELLQVQLPSYDSYGEAVAITPSATGGVVWRFRVSGESGSTWRRVDAMEEELAFTQSATTVTFEAWSQCGKVSQQAVSVYLHLTGPTGYGGETEQPDRPSEVCERFDNLWYQTSVLQPLITDTLCNYPGSDFVELTFDFPGVDSSSGERALSPLPVTGISCFASFDAAADVEPGTAVATQIVDAEGAASRSVVRRFLVELRHDPSTEFLTNLHVSCDFTLTTQHGASRMQSCSRSFVLASCEGPGMVSKDCEDGEALQCVLGKCAGRSLPGPFEACGSTVIRPDAAGNAEVAQGDSECCQACGRELRCVPLLNVPTGEQDVRRCELQPPTGDGDRGRRSENAVVDSDYGQTPGYAYAVALPAHWRRSAGVVRARNHDAPTVTTVLALALAGMALAVVGTAVMRRRGPHPDEDVGGGYVLLRG